MNDKMKIKQLISSYVDDECTPEEKELVEDLILKSSEYQQYYKELSNLSSILPTWKDEELSADLDLKIKTAISGAALKEGSTMKSKSKKHALIGGASFLVAIVALAFTLQNYSQYSLQSRVRDAAQYVKQGAQGRFKSASDDIGDQFSVANTLGEAEKKSVSKFETNIQFKRKSEIGKKDRLAKVASGTLYDDSQLANHKMRSDAPVKRLNKVKDKKEIFTKGITSSTLSRNELITEVMDSRISTVNQEFASNGSKVGGTVQYEPYYLDSDYSVTKNAQIAARARVSGGFQKSNYEARRQIFAEEVDAVGDYIHRKPAAKHPSIPVQSVLILPPSDKEAIAPIEAFNTEEYANITENQFLKVIDNPLSTFSIDVDTASYSNIRRFLTQNQMPPVDAIRIEEMINYFTYDYPQPEGSEPFSITINAATCPWNSKNQLVRIGLKGKTMNAENLPPSNLVFLIDVSGSMNDRNKLPLLKQGFKMMVNQLSANENVAIVVYAGAAGIVLESTPGSNKQAILNAIDRLSAGGSTAGGAGIELAYNIATKNFIKDGNNRVILATDGDFNIGVSSTGALTRLIEEKREQGIFLTVLGFGTGNLKDNRMEQLANKGNGTFYYIDTQREAKKVLVHELGSTLFTIAKDVKLQVEFNPNQIKAYRLIGYENRILAKEDFNDDTKDAGELGAGHTVTALYEIIPVGSEENLGNVDALKYQKTNVIKSSDLMTVKLRYKKPNGNSSKLITRVIQQEDITTELTGDFKFTAAIIEFGLLLKQSKYKGSANYDHVINSANESKGKDIHGYRNEFIGLVGTAKTLDIRAEEGGGIQFK